MRILFVSDLYPPIWVGGYEVNCSEMADLLKARGYTVHVLTSAYKAEQAGPPQADVARELLLKTNLLRPRTPGITGVGRNRVQVQWHNVRVMRRTIRRVQPDVVVFWGCHELGRGLLSAAEAMGRVVYRLADTWLTLELGLSLRPWYYQMPRRLYDAAFSLIGVPSNKVRTDHLVFVSHALQAQYAQIGIDVSRGTVIRCGIPAEFCRPQPAHILARAPGEPGRILYFGQITPEKGVLTLVRALAELRRQPGFEQTRLTILGQAHRAAFTTELHTLVAGLGLREAIAFPPRVPRAALPAVFRQHDLFAFPSEWQEPYALTLLEAMAAAMPIVASLRGGSSEIVRDGENAVAFAAGDATDLAAKMAWVLTHPQEAAAMGRTAAEEIPRSGTLNVQVAALEAYLQAVITEP